MAASVSNEVTVSDSSSDTLVFMPSPSVLVSSITAPPQCKAVFVQVYADIAGLNPKMADGMYKSHLNNGHNSRWDILGW